MICFIVFFNRKNYSNLQDLSDDGISRGGSEGEELRNWGRLFTGKLNDFWGLERGVKNGLCVLSVVQA